MIINENVMMHRQSVEMLGWSNDVDKTMQELGEEKTVDAFHLTE